MKICASGTKSIEGMSAVRGIEGIITSALINQPRPFNGSGSATQMPYHITTTSPSHLYHVPTTSPCTSHSIIHINAASSFIQGVTHYIATNKVDFSRKRRVHFFAILSCDACFISGHFQYHISQSSESSNHSNEGSNHTVDYPADDPADDTADDTRRETWHGWFWAEKVKRDCAV